MYSGKLITKFYLSTIFGTICSTDYQGEIKGMGDNIVIRRTPDIIVSDYVIGSNFTAADYQTPSIDAVELPINKAKKFHTKLNTVDRITSDLDLASIFSEDASYQMKIAIDTDILRSIPTEITVNQGATAGVLSGNINLGSAVAPVAVNSENIVEHILDHAQALDEQNVTDEGRWILLPSWAIQKLKLSPLKNADQTGDSVSIQRNGAVGTIDRFTVYRTNNLLVTDASQDYVNIISGHSAGLAFAAQVSEMEMLQNPSDFGMLVRGLMVYGFKVIEPKFLTLGRIYETAEA